MANHTQQILLSVAVLLTMVSVKAKAECTLANPGPLLKPHAKQVYKKEVHEDRSSETLEISKEETLSAEAFGCEDSWGWQFKLTKKLVDGKGVKSPLEALTQLKLTVAKAIDPAKESSYSVAKTIDDAGKKAGKTKVTQRGSSQVIVVCARKSTLRPKECAIQEEIIFDSSSSNTTISFDHKDLEN